MGSLPDDPKPYVIEDCMGAVKLYSNGTVLRCNDTKFKTSYVEDESVQYKDYLYDPKNELKLRIYKPISDSPNPKFPVIFFIHGGGFCVGSFSWSNSHNSCIRLASTLKVVVVSIDYRLAPERRLPAAMEDSFNALKWLQRKGLGLSEEDNECGSDAAWFKIGEVDFDRVFVVGDSSGGNIAHYLAVRVGSRIKSTYCELSTGFSFPTACHFVAQFSNTCVSPPSVPSLFQPTTRTKQGLDPQGNSPTIVVM